MSTIVSNLYPPLVPNVLPAFIRTEGCKIYFSLSAYNSKADIKEHNGVQISLIDQTTNTSILNKSLYPTGIMLKDLEESQQLIKDDYNYYIAITPSDLQEGGFKTNKFYIAQLRFTSKDATDPPETSIASWLYENRDYFSEWSTICLLRGIDQPNITTNLDNITEELSVPLTNFVGKLSYDQNSTETEYLKSYTITIQNEIGTKFIQTDQIYTNSYAPNQFNYEIQYDLPRGEQLTLIFTYTTNNLYSDSLQYKFTISAQTIYELDIAFITTPDESHGRIIIDIDSENALNAESGLIIKRASSKTGFYIYDTLVTISDSNSSRYIWYDNSIESGVYYKYRIQQNKENGKYVETEDPIICVFEDIFLTCGDRQLKVQFNPVISELKYNTMESQQTTLGSQYPFIRRNGNNYFRSFNISGLVSALMDDNRWYNPNFIDGEFHYLYEREPFTSKSELYGKSEKLYQKYNDEYNINEYQDYIYEREFRQKVMEFLYKNNIKLFRSLTEGNILVKLMNISFQPVETLGRMLYSFSASAVEIDNLNVKNYNKYNVMNNYYHGFKTASTDLLTFLGYQSIVDTIKDLNNKVEQIYRMDIRVNNLQNAIVWVKYEKDSAAIKYQANKYSLAIGTEDDKYPIEDAWFCGAVLDQNQYTVIDSYYNTIDEIKNPVNNGVYQIVDIDEKAFKIDDYISYNRKARLLTTMEEETFQSQDDDWGLFVKEFYSKYIYYNGQWYPFSEDGQVLIPIKARITYYYKEKGEVD